MKIKTNIVFNKIFLHILEFRLALVQLAVTANKAQNILRAKEKIKEAVSKGARVVVLPVSELIDT